MSGSEATHHAVRLARAVTGRRYLVKFQGCFHGWHDSVARNVISPAERAYGLDPLSSGILPDALESTLVADFNDLSSVEELFLRHPEQIAAVILEPIPHNVGAILPTPEFLAGLRQLTEREGTLLIFDEVITGFRHAIGGYQAIANITPDLTTLGKGIANGYPVAALGGRAELMQHFSSAGGDVLLAGTFNGHPVCMAAGIATMTYLRNNEVAFYSRLNALGERMRDGLNQIVNDLGICATVAGYGSVFCLYFCEGPIRSYRDLLVNNDLAYRTFHSRMTEAGAFMIPLSLKRNHITGAHSDADVDTTLQYAEKVLHEMREERLVE
jgi:glutamate-1-semialdehyde-2,1-aminomutase